MCAVFSYLSRSLLLYSCLQFILLLLKCLATFSSSIAIQLNAMIARCYSVLENLISINWYVFFFSPLVACKIIWHWLHCCCFLFIFERPFCKYIKYTILYDTTIRTLHSRMDISMRCMIRLKQTDWLTEYTDTGNLCKVKLYTLCIL